MWLNESCYGRDPAMILQNYSSWIYHSFGYSSLIRYSTRCTVAVCREIRVFPRFEAHIHATTFARYNRHDIHHIRQATTPSRWPFHAVYRFVERYFLVTAARRVGATHREKERQSQKETETCLKRLLKIRDNKCDEESSDKPRSVYHLNLESSDLKGASVLAIICS